jgi:hypothetical protein
MSMSRFRMSGWLIVILATCAAIGAQGGNQVPYPDGYREWTHVKSMVIQKGHPLFDAFGGLHHIYANAAAADALRASKSFPDGAVFVFDQLTATMENNAIMEGPRKVSRGNALGYRAGQGHWRLGLRRVQR